MTRVPAEPGPDCGELLCPRGAEECSQPSWESCLPILNDLLTTPGSNVTSSVNPPRSPQAEAVTPSSGLPRRLADLLPWWQSDGGGLWIMKLILAGEPSQASAVN